MNTQSWFKSRLLRLGVVFGGHVIRVGCWAVLTAGRLAESMPKNSISLDRAPITLWRTGPRDRHLRRTGGPGQAGAFRSASTSLKMKRNDFGQARIQLPSQLKRLVPDQYEASGAIPEYAASGVYRLVSAWSNVADLGKSYGYPDTLHQNITIRVINEKRDPLPALIDLKLLK